ncbi:MAG: PAS domain S-box protein [Myxococcales bacterium]|nr:PAS domain S-box protein [Myxococcales bacterium]
MDGPFQSDRLIPTGLTERLQTLLEEARAALSVHGVAVAELAAPDGDLAPRWWASAPAALCREPLALASFHALLEGPRTRPAAGLGLVAPPVTGSGPVTPGEPSRDACVTVVPLELAPRWAAGPADALLVTLHAPETPPDPALLGELARCLEGGLSHDRRTRLAEIVFRAVEQAADPIELTDREARLLYANASWERTFGYALSESRGSTVGSLFRDPAEPMHDNAFYQFTLATIAGGQAWSGALACRAQDGRRIFCEPMVSPFVATEQGFLGNLAVRRDLTPRRDRDRALAVAHHEFRSVLLSIPDGVAVLREGAIYFVNAALLRMLGRVEEEVIGRPYSDFIHADDQQQFLREHEAGATRVRMVCQDGALRFVEITTAGEVSFEGRPAMILLARDVTDHLLTQAQLSRAEKMSALGALAAGIAHEINNPLAYVLLNLEFLHRHGAAVPERRDKALAEAMGGAERIRDIVKELRAYTGADSPGPPEPVDVALTATSAIKIAQNEIRHRARLERDLVPGLCVMAREGQLVQVLVNLLVNAAQAIPATGGGDAVVRVCSRRIGDSEVEIVVSDTGEGIPSHVLPHVFEAFATAKRRGEGSGLGLAISKRIIDELGGHIGIESTPGVGTRVAVRLPSARVLADSSGWRGTDCHVPSQSGRAPAKRRRARVLVVDDEQAVAESLVQMLPQHEVVTASDAQAALALLVKDPGFDVVLCDLMMPGVSGPDLHRAACEHDPSLGRRFAFMTGGAFTEWAREFIDRTRCPVLEKPFRIAAVVEVVERLLDEEEPTRASG